MRAAGLDPFVPVYTDAAAVVQHVDRLGSLQMPALDQHGLGAVRYELFRRLAHVVHRAHRPADQESCLVEIGRHEVGKRQQLAPDRFDCIAIDQGIP